MMIRVLIAALAASLLFGAVTWQVMRHHRAEASKWRAQAQTSEQLAEQARTAHRIAITTLKEEQARNRDYDAIRAAIAENDDETPIDPVIADALRRLCARDPDCVGADAGAQGAAPAMRRPCARGEDCGSGGAYFGGL